VLSFHILNVGHGSSVVVELQDQHGRHFGLIDSNTSGNVTPKALTKLKQLGATKLSFVGLTHPHTDHYRGLYEVILAYRKAIDHFYSCPFGDLFLKPERLKKIGAGLKRLLDLTDGLEERRAALELIQILAWADEGAKDRSLEWFECRGDDCTLAPPNFTDVEIRTMLPPARVIGNYVDRIMKSDMSILGHHDDNDISLAFRFTYGGKTIVLGGDGTVENWIARQKHERNRNQPIAGHAVNLPHHGSKKDCSPNVMSQLFAADGPRIAITSANGQSHPDLEVIEWLEKNSIHPYCTNLMPACGANAQKLLTLPGLDPQLARWIREVADNAGEVQVCQGDVLIQITPQGDLTVAPEHRNGCGYRGDFDALLGPGAP
jgi:hypothetical protein